MKHFETSSKVAQKCGQFGIKIVTPGFRKSLKQQKSHNIVTLKRTQYWVKIWSLKLVRAFIINYCNVNHYTI